MLEGFKKLPNRLLPAIRFGRFYHKPLIHKAKAKRPCGPD
jgi:hypothetical protein